MVRKAQHVVPNMSGGWSVKKSGSNRATRNFKSRNDALHYGMKVAESQHSQLVVHRKDGRILNSKNYATQSNHPTGRKTE